MPQNRDRPHRAIEREGCHDADGLDGEFLRNLAGSGRPLSLCLSTDVCLVVGY
jgi:hypothetical protein